MMEVLIGIASVMDMLAVVELPVSYRDGCYIVGVCIIGMILVG